MRLLLGVLLDPIAGKVVPIASASIGLLDVSVSAFNRGGTRLWLASECTLMRCCLCLLSTFDEAAVLLIERCSTVETT
jgi:hypothetical protein